MIVAYPAATPPTYECLYEESSRQRLPPVLILAVMKTEGGKMGQFQKNASNGSYDIGPMQVNTIWVKKIAKMTNAPAEKVASALAFNGCWNLAVGAWILRSYINEANGNVWQGVAWYNSHTPKFGTAYAYRVEENLQRILAATKQTIKVEAAPQVVPQTTLNSIAYKTDTSRIVAQSAQH